MRDPTILRAARRLRAIRGEARATPPGDDLPRAPDFLDDNGDGWRIARVIRAIRARAAAADVGAAREVQHA